MIKKGKKHFTVAIKPIILDKLQHIEFDGKKFICAFAGFVNPVQKKWGFLIGGVDSDIACGKTFTFLGSPLKATFTVRRDVTNEWLRHKHETETYIEAWVM